MEKEKNNSQNVVFKFPTTEEFFSVLKEEEYVRNRIYNMRHGKTQKGSHTADQEGLVEGEKENIKNNQVNRLVEFGLHKENSLINYAGRTARIRETAEAIIEVLDISEENVQNYVTELDTIPRGLNNQQEGNSELLSLADRGGKFILELFDVLSNQEEGTNVINVIHKTNLSGMDSVVNRQSGENIMLDIYGKIEESEIQEIDFSAKKEGLNYKKRKDLLFLGDGNVNKIISYLKNDNLFRDAINLYNDQKIQIYQLQNYINYVFKKKENIELYTTYFHYPELRNFCLANLLELKEYEKIKLNLPTIIKDSKKENIYFSFKEIIDILSLKKNPNVDFLIDLFLRNVYALEKVSEEFQLYLKNIFKEGIIFDRIVYYENLMKNYDIYIQERINTIKNKSLDPSYHVVSNKNEESINNIKLIDNNFCFSEELLENDCLSLLNDEKNICIQGNGGSGKSFFSVYFHQQLKENQFLYNGVSYFPIFIQLSGKTLDDLKQEIQNQQLYYNNKGNDKILLFLDSLDESRFCNEEGTSELFNYIKTNNYKTIIQTRKGYINQSSEIKIYNINGMKNSMKYVENYFNGDSEKINRYLFLKNKIKDLPIKDNSLFVVILCKMVSYGGDELEKINNIWDLFSCLVEKVLLMRENKKSGRELNSNTKKNNNTNFLNEKLSLLQEIAFLKSQNFKFDFNYNIDPESLGFLYKENNTFSYDFLHKEFEIYFVLCYFENLIKYDSLSSFEEDYLLEIFFYAYKRGRFNIVNFFIEKKVINFSKKMDNGLYPLFFALYEGDNDFTQFLINHGAKVNIYETKFSHSVIRVCLKGQSDILKSLIDNFGLNVNFKDCFGDPILLHVIESGNLELINWMLEKKADINNADDFGNTILMNCIHLDVSIIKFLIDKGANINKKNCDGEDVLIQSCKNGKIEIIKLLVEKGMELNYYHLLLSCGSGNIDVIKWLIEQGLDINEKDKNGKTALMYACEKGNIDVIKWLIEQGLDINEKDKNGKTALMYACEKGNIDVIKWLMEQGLNINEKDKNGKTALMYACEKGNIDLIKFFIEDLSLSNNRIQQIEKVLFTIISKLDYSLIKLLLQKGLNVNHKDKNGKTILMYFSQLGNFQIIKLLVESGAKINEKDKEGKTALIFSSEKSDFEIVEFLVKNGAEINQKDCYSNTVLIYFIKQETLETIKIIDYLLQEGANINQIYYKYDSFTIDGKEHTDGFQILNFCLLFVSDYYLKNEILKSLIKAGADLNLRDSYGYTPLILACMSRNFNSVKILIENGAKIALEGDNDFTPMFAACRSGNIKLVNFLLENGARINEKDKDGNTALFYGCLSGNIELLNFLVDKGVVVHKDEGAKNGLLYACQNGKIEVVKFLKERGVSLKQTYEEGINLLMKSCLSKNIDLVKYLISQCFGVNDEDDQGNNCFMYACSGGNMYILEYLIGIGVKIKPNNNGFTPLMAACVSGNFDVANYLLNYGVNVNEKDKNGKTALHYASGYIIDLLLDNGAT